MLNRLKRALLYICAFVGLLVILLTVLGGILASHFYGEASRTLPKEMILSFDTSDGLSENESPDSLIGMWRGSALSIRQATAAIREAAGDPRVHGLLLRADTGSIGLARLQELREALLDFRLSGKKIYGFADTFGFESGADNAYYIASTADEIWMQPSGDWGVAGTVLEMPFFRGLLDRLGILPQFEAREEYKNAMGFLTDKSFNPADKAALQELADNILQQKIRAISAARGIDVPALREYINAAPLSSGEALARDLVDTLGYLPQLREKLEETTGAEFVALADYAGNTQTPDGGVPVALIYAGGEVQRGYKGAEDPMSFREGLFAGDIARALREAAEDDDIEAIVLRIDSPGGSYVASDTIWNAVEEAKKYKPVYAVLGDVAASGGYYAAMAADRIFAMPGTLTGSIGVVGGKVSVAGAAEKLGVTFDKVQAGQRANMWSPTAPFTAEEQALFRNWIDRTYRDFVGKFAEARGFTFDEARERAKGRVYTGEQALQAGLIDGDGGWTEAEEDLRYELDMADGQPIDYYLFPKPKKPYEELLENIMGYRDAAEYAAYFQDSKMARALLRILSPQTGVQAIAPGWVR